MVILDQRLKPKGDIVKVIQAGCKILGIADKDFTICVLDIPTLSSNNYQFIAMIDLAFADTYRLYISSTNTMSMVGRAVAHELIHLKQFVDGRLTISSDRKVGMFDGIPILPPYSPEQPHEVEAFKGMYKLWRDIKKYLKQSK